MKEDKKPFGIMLAQIATGLLVFYAILVLLAFSSPLSAVICVAIGSVAFLILRGLLLRKPWSRWAGALALGLFGLLQLGSFVAIIRWAVAGSVTPGVIPVPILMVMGLLNVVASFCLIVQKQYFVEGKESISNKSMETTR